MGTFNNGSLAVYVYNINKTINLFLYISRTYQQNPLISSSTDLLNVASWRNTFADRKTAKHIRKETLHNFLFVKENLSR